MKWTIAIIWIWIYVHLIAAGRRKKARGHTGLLKEITRDYSDLFRPNNGANATYVTLSVDLQDVVNLQEGTLEAKTTFVAWLRLNWTDPRLTWDPDQYGIRDIRLSPNKLWIPDIKLINDLESDQRLNKDWSISLLVTYDGTVRGTLPVHLTVHCGRPRDPHASWQCKLLFRSWTYSVDDLNLQLAMNVSGVSMYNDRVWRITGNEAKRLIVKDACCPERYAQLVYEVKLIRH